MSCSKSWDRVTLFRILPRAFVLGEFKTHRESILFEREQGLMPATQPEVVMERIRREVFSLRKGFIQEAKDRAIEAGVRRISVPLEVHQLDNYWHDVLVRHGHNHGHLLGQNKKIKVKLVRKCPSTNCKGFLNSKWHCELCSKNICKSCNEEKTDGHECDPETVETVKLIRSDTKGCPTCGTLIYRAAGCPQMWCVECHTTFDWNTGEIETGVIHNPHYYEFQRRNGTLQRNPGDIPGGCQNHLPDLFAVPNHQPAWQFHRLIGHIRYGDRIARRRQVQDPNKKNRIEYMLGTITEEQFR
jgi:hypothetical protein